MFRNQNPNPLPSKTIVLEDRNIPAIAKYILSDKCKNIFFMVGAGISTSAGIPDFRSPTTGLYANLERLQLPYPEAVFDINYFKENPQPFWTLAAELYPGAYRPTITHAFIRLLAERGLLHTCFTQNIDTLERIAGVPTDKIVEAHGSFATQRCVRCKKPSPDWHVQDHIKAGTIPFCLEGLCGGLVKPDIVFFGEGLPDAFFERMPALGDADLLFIMGTSLAVHPFAGLRSLVEHDCPRILVNLQKVGDIGSRADDVVLLRDCDEVVTELCQALGQDWTDQLEALWKETENVVKPREKAPTSTQVSTEATASKGKLPKNRYLEEEVTRLMKQIQEKLVLGNSSNDDPPLPKTPKSDVEGEAVPKDEDGKEVEKEASGSITVEKLDVEKPVATEESPKEELSSKTSALTT